MLCKHTLDAGWDSRHSQVGAGRGCLLCEIQIGHHRLVHSAIVTGKKELSRTDTPAISADIKLIEMWLLLK